MFDNSSFAERAEKLYPEHFKRILLGRQKAKRIKVLYPVVAMLVFGVPVSIVTAFVESNIHSEKFGDFAPVPHEMVMPLLYGITVAVFLFAGLFGLLLALFQSKEFLFRAEQNELLLRQEYFSSRIATSLDGFGGEAPQVDANAGAFTMEPKRAHSSEDLSRDNEPDPALPPLSGY